MDYIYTLEDLNGNPITTYNNPDGFYKTYRGAQLGARRAYAPGRYADVADTVIVRWRLVRDDQV